MKKSVVWITLLLALVLAFAVASAEVVSTTPITGERFWGFRVLAVAVEYDTALEAQEFALDSFLATDTWETGNVETKEVYMDRENARIYTNSEPAILAEGAVEGNYVIVEFIDDPLATVRPGEFPQRGWYENPDNGKTETPRISKPNVGTIQQLAQLTAKDGTTLEPTEVLGMTNDYLHPAEVYEWERIEIELESRPGYPYTAYIHLPSDYDGTKTYPIIFNITGGGQLQYIGNGYDNTDIVLFNDHQLYAWTETKDYGFDEEMIVVSLRHQNTSASIKIEGDEPYEDTAAAAKWIIENYAVDTSRLFWCGQSQGSVTCFNVIMRHPELATGYFGTNGGLTPSADFSPEGVTQETIDQAWECLKVFVENKIHLCMTFGEADSNSANRYAATYYYSLVADAYRAEGLSEREIDDLVKVRVMPSSAFTYAEGLTDHNVCRLMYFFPSNVIDAMKIVLSW